MDVRVFLPPSKADFDYKLIYELAPHIIWAAIIITIIVMIGPKRMATAFLDARKISFAGVEIDLKDDIADAVTAKGLTISSQEEGRVAQRALRLAALTNGARLLWIDEHPVNNVREIGLFKRLGIGIDLAASDDEAKVRLGACVYDVVLSSWTRAGDKNAGPTFLPTIRAAMLSPMVIFYVGKERDVPIGAFGLTVRPDELLNLVLDVLERERG